METQPELLASILSATEMGLECKNLKSAMFYLKEIKVSLDKMYSIGVPNIPLPSAKEIVDYIKTPK